jgi:hypothetical protein
MYHSGVFVLNPRNVAFLDGKERLPRTVRPSGFTYLFVAAGVAVCCAVITPILIADIWKQTRLLAHGVKIDARVVHLRGQEESADKDGGEPADAFYVTYRFQAGGRAGPQFYQYETTADEDVHGSLRVGETITVIYDPFDPNVSELADKVEDKDVSKVFIGTIIGGWLIVFYLLLVWWVRVRMTTLRMIRDGCVLNGEVVQCTGAAYDGDYMITLRYCFARPSGHSIDGEARATRDDLAKMPLPTPGTPLRVFYYVGAHYVI